MIRQRRYRYFWVSARWLIDDQLEGFQEYSRLIEQSMERRLRRLVARYRAESKDSDPDYAEHLAEYYAENGQKLDRTFPQYFRQSLFLTTYSFLEQQLGRICKHYERMHKDEVLLEDLRHKGIEQYCVYLSKVVRVPFPKDSRPWQQIRKYNKLRNQLVHVGPRIERDKESNKIKKTLLQLRGVSVTPQGEILLDKECCDAQIKCVEDFVQILFKVLPKD